MRPTLTRALGALAAAALALTGLPAAAQTGPQAGPQAGPQRTSGTFVEADGPGLSLGGRPWRFAGTNNYYLMYGADGAGTRANVDAVLDDAQAAGLDAVRAWAFFTVLDPADRSTSVHQGNGPTWFNAFDATTKRQVFNTGANGLAQLDYLVAAATARGLRLVLPLTNNWSAFGGIDQYVQWADLADGDSGRTWYHDDFFTDPTVRGYYKQWVRTLMNRTNTITGVRYKDDPTVAVWELANEPRCRGSVLPSSPGACDAGNTAAITGWADEMSRYLDSLGVRQLVSLGDEGWFCDRGAPRNPLGGEGYACTNGVDTEAVTRLPHIDAMSLHLYPDHWGYDAAWGAQWIAEHARAATRIGKPVYLGEYGVTDKATRNVTYRRWLDTAAATGTDGTLYWILSSELADGTLYPDYDGYTVYCPSPVCTLVSNHAERMAGEATTWAPVADDDAAVVEAGTPATQQVLANDVAYRSRLLAWSVDLDPTADRRQSRVDVAGGSFAATPDGIVTFTPAPGFAGIATARYTVKDGRGRRSEPATLRVQVKARPGAPQVLFDFEDGTQGWGPAPGWTTSTTTAFATSGTQGLRVDVTAEGWVTGVLAAPLDLSQRSTLTLDVAVPNDGVTRATSFGVSFQNGDAFTWCQAAGFPFVDPASAPPGGLARTRVTVDLTTDLSCDVSSLTDVRQMNVFMNASGVRYLDAVTVS